MSPILVFNDRNGRFGNKLFQVSATVATAKKNNIQYGFNFCMLFDHIFKEPIGPIVNSVPLDVYQQQQWNYYDITLDKSYDFRGYYQSEKFFLNAKNEILELFTFKSRLIENLKAMYPFIEDTCGIHVRRTDYLNQQDYHPIMSLNYFNEAINHTTCKKFSVFSDDISWCKEHLKHLDCIFISMQDYEDFILMSLCKDNIISNSTFSWWAAYLNKNQNKKVIAPHHKKWFGPGYSNLNTIDLYPSEWIQIYHDT